MTKLVYKTEDAVKGGYRSIVEVEGDFIGMEFKEAGSFSADQMQLTLENAIIREMEEGVAEPELRDGAFKCWVKYSGKPGTPPTDKSGYVLVFLASAEENGVTVPPDASKPQRVVIHKSAWDLGYEINNEPVKAVTWKFMPNEATKPVDLSEYVAELLDGKNKAMAVREVMMDAKTKRRAEYKEALQSGDITTLVPQLVLGGNGIYKNRGVPF